MSGARAAGLLLGTVVDAVFGDPRRAHPVAAFGRFAASVERGTHRDSRARGALYVGVLTGATALVGTVVERAGRGHPLVRVATTAAATWVVLGARSLAVEADAMATALEAGRLDDARQRLAHLCGRDAATLDEGGLARATVESVAENTSDAVVAPLLWGAIAGIPGLLGYRAVNTLDAMVGHRSPRYARFGWAAARLDDTANLLPARAAAAVTAACAPVLDGSARGAWCAWCRDAAAHPSPNAGQVEAAFAGALGLRLGGRTVYGYGAQQRPAMGEGRCPDAADVTRGVALCRAVTAASAVLAAGLALARPAVGTRLVTRPGCGAARPRRSRGRPRRGSRPPRS